MYPDYVAMTMTPEQLLEYESELMLRRARTYIQERRPWEAGTLEVFNDLLDKMAGERRERAIN